MPQNDIRNRFFLTSILCFGALTCLSGVVVYFDRSLLNTWIGPAILVAPPIAWLILYLGISPVLQQRIPEAGEMDKTPPQAEESGQAQATKETHIPVQAESETTLTSTPGPRTYSPETSIVQLLGMLQREGRLLDFLQEDIEPYDDAQIGAAVREVHRGCRNAIKDALGLVPVLDAAEGSEVEVEEDFDPTKIKLVGNVHGKPPFKGILRHRGWRYTQIRLPEWTSERSSKVIAPAEIEIK